MMDHRFLLALDAPSDTTKWVMIGLGAFVLLYLIVLRPMMRGKKDPLASPPRGALGAGGGLGSQRAVEREMQNLLVEYEQMIRNMTAGLDTRAAKLEELIKEANGLIASLKGAVASAQAAGSTSNRTATQAAPVDSPPPTGPDPRHVEVYTLADQVMSANDIARKLGRPSGEVELILALRGGRE